MLTVEISIISASQVLAKGLPLLQFYSTTILGEGQIWAVHKKYLKCLLNFLDIPAIDTQKTTSPSLVTLVHIWHAGQCHGSHGSVSSVRPLLSLPSSTCDPDTHCCEHTRPTALHPPQQTVPGARLDNPSLTFIMTQTWTWSYCLVILIWLYFVCMYMAQLNNINFQYTCINTFVIYDVPKIHL